MSRKRHEMAKRAKGGGTKPHWNAGEDQPAAKEAEERRRGGKVDGEGDAPKERHDRAKRARGGGVPGRARGGGVGADRKPLSSAAKVKHVIAGEGPEEGVPSD